MGRVKLKIKRLESYNNRQVTYSKRRAGILKKAKEISILCDIDIALLMFSPSGKPTLCLGERSDMNEVIARFAQLTPQERAKRKLESLEALKKTFKKLDHDVNIHEFLGTSVQTVEELNHHSRLLQIQLAEVHKRLSFWMDPDKIIDLEQIRMMEESLKESLNQIRLQKENIGVQPFIPPQNVHKFEDVHLSSGAENDRNVQPLSWFACEDDQALLIMEALNPLSHGHKEHVNMIGQEGRSLNPVSSSGCLKMQVCEQCPYEKLVGKVEGHLKANADLTFMDHSVKCSHLELVDGKIESRLTLDESSVQHKDFSDGMSIEPVEVSLLGHAVDYHVDCFALPETSYGCSNPQWVLPSKPSVAFFEGNSHIQHS